MSATRELPPLGAHLDRSWQLIFSRMPLSANISGPLAIFLPSLRGGGAERTAILLAEGLRGKGLDVHLLVAEGGALGPHVASDLRIVGLGAERVASSLPRVIRYLQAERPRAVISEMGHTSAVALLARMLSGVGCLIFAVEHIPIRFHRNDRIPVRIRSWIVRALNRILYRFADEVVAVSAGVADDVAIALRYPRNRIRVLANPVITRSLFERSKEPPAHAWLAKKSGPVVIAIGRLSIQKDFATLLRAFKCVRERTPARLIILGEGGERGRLEELRHRLGLDDDVDLPGFADNPYSLLKASDLFVLTSICEGLSTVIIEALALHVPVVATDCPSSPRDLLKDGEYGILVPVGDVQAIANGILEGLERPRKAPPSWIAPYQQDQAVNGYLELLLNSA